MTPNPVALLDSNVVIAAVVEEHQHHLPSAALLDEAPGGTFAVAAHSFAEAFSTLTRKGPRGFGREAGDAWSALQSMAAITVLVGLSPSQTLQAIGGYAAAGGTGARLYDHLIGAVAVQYALPRIVTWNLGHMRDLFPQLQVVSPEEAMQG